MSPMEVDTCGSYHFDQDSQNKMNFTETSVEAFYGFTQDPKSVTSISPHQTSPVLPAQETVCNDFGWDPSFITSPIDEIPELQSNESFGVSSRSSALALEDHTLFPGIKEYGL